MKTFTFPFELTVKRDIADSLGLSAEALNEFIESFQGAFREAALQALENKLLPTKIILSGHFHFEGEETNPSPTSVK